MRLMSLFRNLFRKRAIERELEEELGSSLEILTREKMKRGLSWTVARRAAAVELGGVEQVGEQVRAVRAGRLVEDCARDVRFAFRSLAKSPLFTVVAIIILALGIGVNTTVFTWVDGILLQPMPGVARPQELAAFETFAGHGDFVPLSYPDYRDYRDHLTLLAGLATTEVLPLSIGQKDEAEQLQGEMVSGNYFTLLGITPVLGRAFKQAGVRDKPDASPVAVISSHLWRVRFNADPGVVGKTIWVNQHALTIIGVAPSDFHGAVAGVATSLWIPYMMHPELQGVGAWMLADRGTRQIYGIARLKPGVTLAQATAEAAALALRMSKANPPQDTGITARLVPIGKWQYGMQGGALQPLEILTAVCWLVLLIVCANLANLFLARFSTRQKEFSLRLALGAGQFRLARQIFTEIGLLVGAGGVAGVALAVWLSGALRVFAPPGYPFAALHASLNWRILGFAALLCLLAAILTGLAPAIQSARADVNRALKEGGRAGAAGRKSQRLRSILVTTEIALALVALAFAGLLARSFEAARNINPEFAARHVLMARFSITTSGLDVAQRKAFSERLRENLETMPRITDVAYSDVTPLGLLSGWWEPLRIQGYVAKPGENMKIYRSVISPGYLGLLHIPLLAGRDFTQRDDLNSQPVAIVNQAFARRFFGGHEAIGQKLNGWGKWFTVVGVAKDSKYLKLTEEPTPFFYVPFRQVYRADMGLTFYLRVSGDPDAALPTLRRAARSADSDVAIVDAGPLAEHIVGTLFAQKIAAGFVGVLAALALLLAALGLYAVTAYSVTQRTHEFGICMALGAQRKDVLKLVTGQALVLIAAGIAAGIVVALGLTRLAGGFLYGITTTDPVTLVAASVLLAAVALLANIIPARRATRVDPMVALRHE